MKKQLKVKFEELAEKMPGLLQDLKSQPFRTKDNLSDIPKCGIYVFYENNKPLYVGRSNRLKARLRRHSQQSSKHNSATFAFNLAKEKMEKKMMISDMGRRKELEQVSEFNQAFRDAKRRVSKMKIRVVQVDDQVTQALFEIYAALALETKYNDFRTH